MHRFLLARPAPPLAPFVRFYSQREACLRDGVVVHPVHARAAPMLEFVFGDRFKVTNADGSGERISPRTVIVGSQTYPRAQLHLSGTIENFVIMFQPTGLNQLFAIPMTELTNCDYDAQAVLGPAMSSLEQSLGEASTFAVRVGIVDAFLSHLSLQSRSGLWVAPAVRTMMRTRGCIQIERLARAAGVSPRQFERTFKTEVGIRPKLFARIVRFESALDNKARHPGKSWANVAHEFGYFDQMHMIHDFDELTGGNPTETLGKLQFLFREQIEAALEGRSSGAGAGDRYIL